MESEVVAREQNGENRKNASVPQPVNGKVATYQSKANYTEVRSWEKSKRDLKGV